MTYRNAPPHRSTARSCSNVVEPVRPDFSPIDFSTDDAAPREQGMNHFSPIDFSSTPDRLDTTRLNYDGTGERPQEVSDDLPEDTALRVIGPPVAFALIIIIGSQVVHFK